MRIMYTIIVFAVSKTHYKPLDLMNFPELTKWANKQTAVYFRLLSKYIKAAVF